MTPRCRLLALDVDGTVVDPRGEVTPATRKALAEALDAGVTIVLATGRRYRRTLPVAEAVGVTTPLVTTNGCLIKDPATHATQYCASLSAEVMTRLLAGFATFARDPLLYADTYHQGFDVFVRTFEVSHPAEVEYHERNRDSLRTWPRLFESPPPDVFAAFGVGSRDEMTALQAHLEAALGDELYVHVLRSPVYTNFMCEIAPAGESKWAGVRRLARQWGIADEEIWAVGDDVNDLPMLQGAGLGVAMGNAVDSVKEAADRVAPSNADDGLAQVVRWLLD